MAAWHQPKTTMLMSYLIELMLSQAAAIYIVGNVREKHPLTPSVDITENVVATL